jgi:glycosyltransferase involved in cell wall biosynthesis
MKKVSVIIVVRNEENYIIDCIKSIEKQFSNSNDWELIIVDGMSEDRTRIFAENYLKNKRFKWKIVENPKKILASGWNIGIKLSTGEYIIRPDAHSKLCKNYIKEGISTFESENLNDMKIACVGGVLDSIGEGFWGEAIADLFSSKFGVGNSAFRIGVEKLTFTDTAVFGLYKREVFEKVGLFNENLKRNQDLEFHIRLSKAGYKFVTNPKMRAKYYVRSTIKDLVKKAFNDGYWIILGGFRARHIIPFLFITYIIMLPIFYSICGIISFIPLTIYFILDIFFSLKDGKNLKNKILLFILYPLFHTSYGLGSLTAFLKKIPKGLNKFLKIKS